LKRVIAGVALVGLALLAYFLFRGDDEASAESKYDGVHLCAPSQQEAATVAAGKDGSPPTPSGNLDLEPSRTKGPLFAQNASAWGGEEYDHGAEQDVGCGQTIAQCGCAMTSVATILALFQLMTTPDGQELNPSTLNGWFNEGAQLTNGGWVSQGYAYGNVVWTAVNNFSAAIPGLERGQSVRFSGWGSGDENEIRDQLRKGNKVSIEVPGHYVAGIGLQGDTILINDPAYADRVTLDAYAGRVRSSRIYEPSTDLSGIMISVPADQKVQIKDSQGRVVGTLGGGDPEDRQKSAKLDIPGAQYHFEEAWRDPTCTERPPRPGQGVNSIFIPNPADGNYTVEVLGARDTAVVVYLYDKSGNLRMITREGADRLDFSFTYGGGGGGGGGAVTPTPTSTGTITPTPTPTPTPTLPPGVLPPEEQTGVTPEPEGPTVTPTPGVTVTPTATATVTPTGTIGQTPGLVSISTPTVELLPNGLQGQTCGTRISWNALGEASSTIQLLRNGIVVYTTTPGQRTYLDQFSVGSKSYVVRGTNSAGAVTTTQSVNVNPWCLQSFNVTVYGSINCDGTCYGYAWNVVGNVTGFVEIYLRVGSGGFEQEDSVTLSPQLYERHASLFEQCAGTGHRIVVGVGSVEVTSNIKTIPPLDPYYCPPPGPD
jgi:hypothetical protein